MSNKRSKHLRLSLITKNKIACKLSQENVNVSRSAKNLNIPKSAINTLGKHKKIISKFDVGRNVETKKKRRHFLKVNNFDYNDFL